MNSDLSGFPYREFYFSLFRVCLKSAFRELYAIFCGGFIPNEGGVVGSTSTEFGINMPQNRICRLRK